MKDLATITVDRKYTSGGVNITGFRLVHTDSPKSQYVLDFLKSQNKSEETGTNLLLTTNALIIDSINLLAAAINNLRTDDKDFRTVPINCNLTDTRWSYGSALVKEISELSFDGLTGTINIKNGRRADFDLELVEFDIEGKIQTVGNWDANKGLNISTSAKRRRDEILRDLNNKTLDVVVKPEAPFIMPTGENSTKFYGYAMDMLEYLAKELNFSYNIIKVPDETSGRQLSNGSWTGMIGMLIRNEADIALGDLTINHERSRVIDFTKPFMTLGISILYKKPEKKGLVFFSFMEPLNNRIWVCVIAAYIGVSLFCFFIARFSPYQWRNPHPCNPETDLIENEFTLLNSFWFTIASLMQQGSEVTPRAISTRLVAGFWHLFTLILISSYTANLAAFLTINRMSTPIQNAEDLAKQTAIKYGCQYGESTYRFFQVAQMSTYEKMWNSMSQNPNVFVNKSDLGIAKVKAGNYAYLMESIPLRYQLSQHCDLMEVGDELDSKGYGIGLPKNSPFRDMLSEKVLYLSENQILIRLYNKWWKKPEETCKSQSAEDFTSSTSANQLGLDNLGGVFVILGGGLVLAIIIGTLEFCINAFVNSKSDRRSMCAELLAECQFAGKCWVPVNKPVQLVPSNLTSMAIGQSDNEVEICNLIRTEHS